MNENTNIVHISGAEPFITETPEQAYLVSSGKAEVYITRIGADGRPVGRVFLCSRPERTAIPSFSFEDAEHVQWRFLVQAVGGSAELMQIRWTSMVLKNFQRDVEKELSERKEPAPDFVHESFSSAVVDFYDRNSLKGKVLIHGGKSNDRQVEQDSGKVIAQSFAGETTEGFDVNEPVYRAFAYICRASAMTLPDLDTLRTRCGKKATVPQLAAASRIACRSVILQENWFRMDNGPLICTLDGKTVACVPQKQQQYTYYIVEDDEKGTLTKELAEQMNARAFALARTLPGRSIGKKELWKFCCGSLRKADVTLAALLGLACGLLNLLLPSLNQKIYDDYIPLGRESTLVEICSLIASFMLVSFFFEMVRKLTENRIAYRIGYDLQNATYYRVFHLPERFFRDFDSADLARRVSTVSSIATTFVNIFVVSGFGFVFSLLYLIRMFKSSARMTWYGLLMLLIYGAIGTLLSSRTLKSRRSMEENDGKASAELYQYLSGIEKLRMAGAEERAALRYLRPFSAKESEAIRMSRYSELLSTLSGAASTVFSMVFYVIIVKHVMKNNQELTAGSFMAFNAAFGSFSAAFLQLLDSLLGIFQLKPQYERVRPVFETAQEDEEDCEAPGQLRGEVRLENLHFSYTDNGPEVLKGIDIVIKSGEYVGIVGSSGCGKSTMLKLMLGFEKPKSGAVLYDGHDLARMDKRALRKNLGVVLQNGQLISGSIFENITITAPDATMPEVQKVIEAVGLKDDIANMPMGLQTVLSEDSGTISGGQKQRILIARAIINNPAILIFDEATSALDNVTQAAVCESLDKMSSTRIVVAHRLSTIQNCDRILVLDGGKVVEEGTYEQLYQKKGLFYELAVRQQIDEEER